jgi:hypothetical protein
MNKLVINTQYLENYGTSESPYMKFKGGNTYVMDNCGDLDENQVATITAQVRPYITTTLIESNGGCEEYIIDTKVMGQRLPACDEWVTPTTFHIVGNKINFMKITDNREDGWMRKEILEKTETWTNNRKSYKASYLMEDGDICDTEAELKAWFEIKEVA